MDRILMILEDIDDSIDYSKEKKLWMTTCWILSESFPLWEN